MDTTQSNTQFGNGDDPAKNTMNQGNSHPGGSPTSNQTDISQQNPPQSYQHSDYQNQQNSIDQPPVARPGTPEAEAIPIAESISAPETKETQPGQQEVVSQEESSEESKGHLLKQEHHADQQEQQAQPQTAEDILGVKMYGYGISTQLANMKHKFRSMQGRGNPGKAKSWLVMLLDRMLRKEDKKVHTA